MRITFPVLTLCHGGAQRMLAEITNWLSNKGHEVIIIMPSGGVVEYDIESNLIRTSRSVLKSEDFPPGDVIISNFFTTVPVVEEASRQGKGIHIRFALCYEPVFLSDNFASFPTYSATQHLLVLFAWQQQLIQLIHGIRGYIVPIGVNPFFQNLNIRQSIGESLNITAVVRQATEQFSWHRDQEYLLYNLAYIKSTRPEVNINLICPPAEYYKSPELQEYAARHQFRVWTPANDDELRWHYNNTDIFVSSSVYDSGALPGLEAMRCGAALITVYSGGNMDYVRPDVNCLLSYRFENRLASDILQLVDNSALRKKLASRGETDSYMFNWELSSEAFEKAILSILNRTT